MRCLTMFMALCVFGACQVLVQGSFIRERDSPCFSKPCLNGGECRVLGVGSSYRCLCPEGFRGKHCQEGSLIRKRDSPCFSKPCRNGGKCRVLGKGSSYGCECPEGFQGKRCEKGTGMVTCKDSDRVQCPIWAGKGYCKSNPFWMKVNCQKSCNTCECADSNIQCHAWAKEGECSKNPQYMKINCKLSCEQCQKPLIEA